MNDDGWTAEREALLSEIRAQVRETAGWTGRDVLSDAVMWAIGSVPRHDFVPEADRRRAYWNQPLPIGHGQTISQPYIVAIMTDLLNLAPGAAVLEIGTGCGYQAAVLAAVGADVYSVEMVASLADAASERLTRLGYDRVHIRTGDGREGWPEHAPYDGVIVTAAAERIPRPLIEQLKPGGRLVAPVGPPMGPQVLVVGAKRADGRFESVNTLPVAFVPLVARDSRKSLY